MASSIIIEVDAKAVLARVRDFESGSLLSLTETLGALVEGQTKRRLSIEKTAPDGTSWKPLAPLTVRARRNRSNSPLTDTGRLMGSITHHATESQAIVGTSLFYAGFHQFGVASIKPKKGRRLRIPLAGGGAAFASETSIPARPFLGISKANMKEIEAAVNAWLKDGFR